MKTAVQSRLKKYIKDNGIKQRHISQVTGLKEYMVSDIFCNRRELRADEYVLICKAIGKNPDDFISE